MPCGCCGRGGLSERVEPATGDTRGGDSRQQGPGGRSEGERRGEALLERREERLRRIMSPWKGGT